MIKNNEHLLDAIDTLESWRDDQQPVWDTYDDMYQDGYAQAIIVLRELLEGEI